MFKQQPHLIIFFTFIFLLLSPQLQGQSSLKARAARKSLNAGELQLALHHSRVLGSVLYFAAHPDDENTRLIAYFTKGKGYHTSYLSLTRGDGGQNLIGTEKGPGLGLIRTNELLAARNIDGAHQRFSRAIDFGYSKNPEETLEIWDRDKVLGDAVRVIRELQPDIIVTRFPGPEDGGGGHGHHTASYILAKEAFNLAADATAFPEQLQEGLSTWQAKRLFWNTWKPYWVKDYPTEKLIKEKKLIKVNIGEYNPLLGKSYGEIASEARSQHKCQAFGTAKIRGTHFEYLSIKAGDSTSGHAFEGVDVSWGRIKGGARVDQWLERAEDEFDPKRPSAILPYLLRAYQNLLTLPESHWVSLKEVELKELIAQCSGLWFEALAGDPLTCQGDSLELTTEILKRSDFAVKCRGVRFFYDYDKASKQGETIGFEKDVLENNGKALKDTRKVFLHYAEKPTTVPTQAYWLSQPGEKGIYQVQNPKLIGKALTPAPIMANFAFSFGEKDPVTIFYDIPVVHKYVDRAVGELYRPFVIAPRVTVNISEKVYLFGNDEKQEVKLLAKSHSQRATDVTLKIKLPEGWKAEPSEIAVSFAAKGEEQQLSFVLTPPAVQSQGELHIIAQIEDELSINSFSQVTLEYDHIPTQTIFPPSSTRLVKVDMKKEGEKVAYIMGSGDEIPTSLRQVGYQVDLLEDADISFDKLKEYDAVIAGIRAYNTRDRLTYLQKEIFKYIEDGGVYIVQYNTTYSLKTDQAGPYPIKISRDRVTVEEAPIRILKPDHPIFNYPNKITDADFENWVQERGLYFPDEWDEAYTPLVECNDPGEDPKQGALLVARHGKGWFIYTGFSFFRELPAAVPGAYRLFANMISVGKAK